jgi:hypothetical protein
MEAFAMAISCRSRIKKIWHRLAEPRISVQKDGFFKRACAKESLDLKSYPLALQSTDDDQRAPTLRPSRSNTKAMDIPSINFLPLAADCHDSVRNLSAIAT